MARSKSHKYRTSAVFSFYSISSVKTQNSVLILNRTVASIFRGHLRCQKHLNPISSMSFLFCYPLWNPLRLINIRFRQFQKSFRFFTKPPNPTHINIIWDYMMISLMLNCYKMLCGTFFRCITWDNQCLIRSLIRIWYV